MNSLLKKNSVDVLTSASVLSLMEIPDVELLSCSRFCICEISTIELLSYKTVAVTTLLQNRIQSIIEIRSICKTNTKRYLHISSASRIINNFNIAVIGVITSRFI